MWLPLMLLALMASGSACPVLCQCHQSAASPSSPTLTDVTCLGRVPLVSELPADARGLIVDGSERDDVLGMLDEFEATEVLLASENFTSGLPGLEELTLTNCSLLFINSSWLGFDRLRVLNLSCNDLADVQDLRVSRATNLTELRSLDLSGNSLENLSAGSFRTLGGLVRLSLRRNRIAIVHEEAFRGLDVLEGLDLSDNKLADLPDNALTPLYSLQKLDLSGNQLQVLGARWFESLDMLRELDVSRNGLARAASGTLQPLPGLSVLRLAENPLKERDVSLLLGTGRRLETVDASRTGLARVPAALTRSVRTLRLAGNKLTTIRSGDLDSYPLLRMLDISDNRLVDIEEDALGRLEVLEELDISGNALLQIPGSLPSSLTHLDLQYNRITALRLNDFQGLYSLRSLILNDNDIENIEEGSLSQLSILVELDLSNNPIKALPTNTLSGLNNIATLRMSGLTFLQPEQQKQGDMSFPVPTPERLALLDVSRSPVLAGQLLADDAALSACKSLVELNLSDTNITALRSDLLYLLPQLRTLGLSGNEWNCTEDLYWLGDWIRQHKEHEPARCSTPKDVYGVFLSELPAPPTPLPTITTTSTSTTPTSTTTAIPTSIIYLIEQTIPYDEVNVTMSSYANSINVSEIAELLASETSAGANSQLAIETESEEGKNVTNKVRTESETDSSASRITADSSPTGRDAPAIYEAPTSFRNITTSYGAQKVKKQKLEESRKKVNVTNHLLSDRNVTKDTASALLRTKDLKTSSIKKTEDSSKENRVDGRRPSSGKSKKFEDSRGKVVFNASKAAFLKQRRAKAAGNAEDPSKLRNLTRANLVAGAVSANAADTNTIAEELSGRATDSGARVSESLSAGAHPGMLVLAGAALSAAAALTVVLSRRATARRRERYQRHENIEVHTLTPTTELW